MEIGSKLNLRPVRWHRRILITTRPAGHFVALLARRVLAIKLRQPCPLCQKSSFHLRLLTHLLALQARLKDSLQKNRLILRNAHQPLIHSWRLLLLMAKLRPYSTAVIILGRFYKRLMPSFDLRIKGEFVDMVTGPVKKTNRQRCKRRLKKDPSTGSGCICWESYIH
jgi:hypothetical protein